MSDSDRCELCEEKIKTYPNGLPAEEVGEFWDEEAQDSVYAHAQCGLDKGMELA